MGAWGVNILQDDTALDIHSDYLELYNAGKSHDSILAALRKKNAAMLDDEDDGPLFWLGVARAQWDCGALDAKVLKRVEKIISHGEGLSLWEEAGITLADARKRALAQFLDKLRAPNPRPRKPKKGIRRKPIFQKGDCLAIRLSDRDYAAAIVLDCPREQARPGGETYGLNLIGQLYYKSRRKPTQEDFEARRWLELTHHNFRGGMHVVNCMALRFRKYKDRFEVVGKTQIRKDDPSNSNTYATWGFASSMVYQASWDKAHPRRGRRK